TIFWPWAVLTLAGYVPWWWGPSGYAYGGYYNDGYYGDGYASSGYANRTYAGYGGAFLGVVFDSRFPDAAVVSRVYANSPAEDAGLQPGDTITRINGQRIHSSQDVTE